MRDEHRPKQDLIHEITGLRKQVGDLRQEMTARRRVEDALRGSTALLRNLADSAPVGLGLFRCDGTVLAANQRLAQMLGYESPAELQSLSTVVGVFASPEEQVRALESPRPGESLRSLLFRSKNGCRLLRGVLPGGRVDTQGIVLAVFDSISDSSATSFPVRSA
jgi:PAS domain S-box-containing protein